MNTLQFVAHVGWILFSFLWKHACLAMAMIFLDHVFVDIRADTSQLSPLSVQCIFLLYAHKANYDHRFLTGFFEGEDDMPQYHCCPQIFPCRPRKQSPVARLGLALCHSPSLWQSGHSCGNIAPSQPLGPSNRAFTSPFSVFCLCGAFTCAITSFRCQFLLFSDCFMSCSSSSDRVLSLFDGILLGNFVENNTRLQKKKNTSVSKVAASGNSGTARLIGQR